MGILDVPGITAVQADKRLNPSKFNGLVFNANERNITVSSDTATVVVNALADATYNRAYARGASTNPPVTWPVDNGRVTMVVGGVSEYQFSPAYLGPHWMRFMMDGSSFALQHTVNAAQGFMIYVDGHPLSTTPFTSPIGTAIVSTVVFDDGPKTRLIEIYGNNILAQVFAKKPYKIWKPPTFSGPKILVVGDSYTSPTIWENAGPNAANANTTQILGMYQGMAPLLGVEEVMVNGVGGTGYGQRNGDHTVANTYLERIQTAIDLNPDVLIVHGGGANDLYNGQTVSQVNASVAAYFTAARAALPKAKLVFIEGFAPPIGFGSFNASYTSIRQTAQTNLASLGIYYVDVATTEPWINGLGYSVAPNADNENSSIYVGNDGVHMTILGNASMRERMAPKIRTILRDKGDLVNQLI